MVTRPSLHRRIPGLSLLLLALVAALHPARAANDLVLRLNSTTSTVLAGESTVANHVGEIDVIAFTWGVNRSSSASTASAQNLTLTKRVDKSSPTLMLGVFQGTRFPSAVLFVRNQATSGTALDFFKITLTDVAVTAYSTSTSNNGELIEQVSFSMATVKFDYQPQNPDGTANGAIVTGGWNITTNQRL